MQLHTQPASRPASKCYCAAPRSGRRVAGRRGAAALGQRLPRGVCARDAGGAGERACVAGGAGCLLEVAGGPPWPSPARRHVLATSRHVTASFLRGSAALPACGEACRRRGRACEPACEHSLPAQRLPFSQPTHSLAHPPTHLQTRVGAASPSQHPQRSSRAGRAGHSVPGVAALYPHSKKLLSLRAEPARLGGADLRGEAAGAGGGGGPEPVLLSHLRGHRGPGRHCRPHAGGPPAPP